MGCKVRILPFVMGVLSLNLALQPKVEKDPSADVARASTKFTTEFHCVVSRPAVSNGSGTGQKNLIFSPFSLSDCIGMLKAGAGGDTASEMQRGLKCNENFALETANSLYTTQGFKVSPRFESVVTNYFHAHVEQLDFSDKSESAKRINGFVQEATHNRIKDLISPDDLTADTRLVLVNAIYFKGLWKNKFDPTKTVRDKFHVSPDRTVDVDMMKITAEFKYGEVAELDAKVISLPYKGDQLSLVVMLPNQVENGLTDLDQRLRAFDLGSIQTNLHTRKVELSLPKFKLDSEIDLRNPLEALGMKSMFDPARADLSGIADDDGSKQGKHQALFVSKAIQKAFLEVNEEGSEAAAATVSHTTLFANVIHKIKILRIDRPFLAFIQAVSYNDQHHGNQHQDQGDQGQGTKAPFQLGQEMEEESRPSSANVLFMARVVDPTVSETLLVGGELRMSDDDQNQNLNFQPGTNGGSTSSVSSAFQFFVTCTILFSGSLIKFLL